VRQALGLGVVKHDLAHRCEELVLELRLAGTVVLALKFRRAKVDQPSDSA
jgi:hypothetical protein